ncbi:SymE family type I addiction module toxin [[Clostridium] symbiosum]|uniref:SymE family type I addiction module toxin n=1 Tax=Clostridium symbiosum TaxID=1512 RepID=UPI003312FD0A
MQTKNLKVAYTSRPTKYSYTSVPKIQMEGKWLEELGFSIGTFLKVEFEEGSIRIRPFTEEETMERRQQELKAEFDRKSRELEKAQAGLAASYASISPALSQVAEPDHLYSPSRRKHK